MAVIGSMLPQVRRRSKNLCELRGRGKRHLSPASQVPAQWPIGWVVGRAFPIAVAAGEHSGWPNPLALTPFV